MHPYLQTPSATSMYVCWLAASGTESTVQYGTSEALGMSQSGDVHVFSDEIKWHWANLQNLSPNTVYYYKCITGSQVSDIYSFQTIPESNTIDGHLRIIFIGDTRTNVSDLENLVTAIQDKCRDLYGEDWRHMINLICHTGDTVEWAGQPDPFVDQFFIPFSPLSAYIPIMVSPGNHEGENQNFYDFMKTEGIAGPEGKMYFTFNLANSKFIFMDSNIGGDTQLNWVSDQLNTAATDDGIDFVFGVTHHFGHSEILPSENNNWVQNSVLPAFNVISKPCLLAYGHAHTFERGTTPWGRTRLLLAGGGGAPLDQWGNDADQQDYPEIQVAMDFWNYTILDIDLNNHTYDARVYSLGNSHFPLLNEEIDTWSQAVTTISYQVSALSAKAPTDGLVKLVSNAAIPYSNMVLMSSQIQVSASPTFNPTIVDKTRDWVDFYGDSGAPDYTPTNLNAGIDLKRLTVPFGLLDQGQTYFWKIRYRSQNTDWGNWSNVQAFTYTPVPFAADFAYSQVGEVNEPIQFTDTSVGDVTSWHWYFDNPYIIQSSQQDPVWIFTTPGQKEVFLSVEIDGDTYSTSKTFFVNTPVDDNTSPAPVRKLMTFPNPFGNSTNISFELKSPDFISVDVYNIRGKHIRNIEKQQYVLGKHVIEWDGRDNHGELSASGVYLIKVTGKSKSLTGKVLYLK